MVPGSASLPPVTSLVLMVPIFQALCPGKQGEGVLRIKEKKQ